jgi:hypothetical protein
VNDRRPLAGIDIEYQPGPVVCGLALVGEARGERDEGGNLEALAMLAILWVAENRRQGDGRRWPSSLKAVFLQRHQFSCFNAEDPNRPKLLTLWRDDPVTWERADTVCDLFESGWTVDPTMGATHYCSERLWGRDDSARPGGAAWHSLQEIEAGRT